ncbi:MAG: lactate racemase domain-containing protein [Candidatus Velthaea sp.]
MAQRFVPAAETFPSFVRVRQRLDSDEIADIADAVADAFEQGEAARRIRAGARIAITAGSRGVDRIPEVLRAVADRVRALGGEPFISAAMGSHGGATDDGQRDVLRGYGITEASVGAPIVSSMETREYDGPGGSVYCDRAAAESDGIIVVGRVKPHTSLVGPIGSGLLKMTAIGLGKRGGADALHRLGLQNNLVPWAKRVLARAPILFGIALVENGVDRLTVIEGTLPEQFEDTDARLLALARELLPQIPFDPIDFLIVDRVGKNISGTGMDPNVIGLHRRIGGAPQRNIKRIAALDLTDDSHGNAMGIAMADVITQRLLEKIDFDALHANAMTSNFIEGAKLPVAAATDRDVVSIGCKGLAPDAIRAVHIADTAHLEEFEISSALLGDARANSNIEVLGELAPLRFTGGRLAPV